MKVQEKLGKEIEAQVLWLLRLYGFNAEPVPQGQGIDLIASFSNLAAQMEIKGMRDWTPNTGGYHSGKKTRGRAIIRRDSHSLLLEHPCPIYVFCQYKLPEGNGKPISQTDAIESLCLTSITYSPAHLIHVEQPRISLSSRQVLSFPQLLPRPFRTYLEEYYAMGL